MYCHVSLKALFRFQLTRSVGSVTYSFASNVGGKTKASSGAPEKQTAKATYTAVQRDFDNNYYAYFDESDLPEGVTKTELEENWFKDMNYYPVKKAL